MGMWEILEEGRGEYDRDFGMRSGNPMEEALWRRYERT